MNEDQDVKMNPDITPETKATLAEATAPVETAFAAPATPVKKRPLKLIIAAIIVAMIVALVGGSVFGYTMWYQNPDKVVHDAILHAIKAKTEATAGTITYTGDGIKMDIALDSKSTKGNGEFTIGAKVTIDTDEMQQDFNANGTGRIADDVLYVKITGIKDIVEDTAAQSGGQIPEYAASIFEKIEDKWISIKASDYQEASEEIAAAQTCFMDLFEKMQSDTSMMNEVANIYRDNQVLIVKEELGNKDINGTDSLGYKVDFDQDAAVSFIRGLDSTSYGKALKNCSEDIDFHEIANDLNEEVIRKENTPVVELWVSTLGHEITEVAIYGDTNGKDALNITLQPVFDTNITIEAPDDAESLKDVLQEIQETITEYYSQTGSTDTLPSRLKGQTIDGGQLQPAI